MKRWVIVPVKRLATAKSRLASALSTRQRRTLARALLDHTLEILHTSKGIDGILVVSKDRAVLASARKSGAGAVPEARCDGLNRALARASDEAVRCGAQAVLILPVDLPMLSVEDLHRAVKMGHRPPFLVIAPDRMDRGTNLLYMAPPGVVKFSFGRRSFHRHLRLARRAGIKPVICRRSALAHDVDRPEDLPKISGLWSNPVR
jgi:2-phospho-L-lactate guanylyltransferase